MYYMWLYVANPAKQGFAKSETVRELVRLAAKVPCGAGYHHPSIPPSLFALRASHLQKKEKRRKEGGKPLPAVNSKPGRSPVVCSLCRHSVPPRVIERARNRSRDTQRETIRRTWSPDVSCALHDASAGSLKGP